MSHDTSAPITSGLTSTAVSLAGSRKLLQQKNYPFYPNSAEEALAILAITHRGLQAVFALVHWCATHLGLAHNRFPAASGGGHDESSVAPHMASMHQILMQGHVLSSLAGLIAWLNATQQGHDR